jgi:transposase-like protein
MDGWDRIQGYVRAEKVINKTILPGCRLETGMARRKCLGMWVWGETESASFWSGVLSDFAVQGPLKIS